MKCSNPDSRNTYNKLLSNKLICQTSRDRMIHNIRCLINLTERYGSGRTSPLSSFCRRRLQCRNRLSVTRYERIVMLIFAWEIRAVRFLLVFVIRWKLWNVTKWIQSCKETKIYQIWNQIDFDWFQSLVQSFSLIQCAFWKNSSSKNPICHHFVISL